MNKLAKLWIFKLDYEIKPKNSYDVIFVTSPSLCHKIFPFWGPFPNQNFCLSQCL